jgi:hypothetical protein
MQQKRPSEQWERVEVPDWRIVPEELWDAVRQESIRRAGELRQKQGSSNRTDASRKYLFSGLLVCGACGGRMNIVGMKNGRVRYGCSRYRFSGTCDNKMTLRRDALEEHLIGAFVRNLLTETIRKNLEEEFVRQATLACNALRRNAQVKSEPNQLRIRRQQLRQQSDNLVTAIADGAGSPMLYERLRSVETQLATLAALALSTPTVESDEPRKSVLVEYLSREAENLTATLLGDRDQGKLQLARHLQDLTLIPKQVGGDALYEVGGAGAGVFSSGLQRSPDRPKRRTAVGISPSPCPGGPQNRGNRAERGHRSPD